jgi:4'-phosphopantetheinyl transferase
VAPIAWRFETNEYGKPRVAADHGLDWLSFNVSNTRGMVACAVCRDVEIGVDVEADSQRYDPEVAKRFFTHNETAAIESAASEDRRERFLRTWTLKESVVKATGLGLSCPLSAFDVEIDADPPQVVFTDRMAEDRRLWQLFGLRLESGFHVALAVRRSADRQLRLSVERLPPEALGSGDV